ncbi:hypothetical protein HJG60_009599 [Phyllostomus discolor]|uniref:Uncharacterized protein n=1 Tax=Phyllostomus discolor TaxID=89673 RepID=A0A833YHQ8_9CHIR|nr:hypothetical protein HJG60_009599 [Phyllostomus discolor]
MGKSFCKPESPPETHGLCIRGSAPSPLVGVSNRASRAHPSPITGTAAALFGETQFMAGRTQAWVAVPSQAHGGFGRQPVPRALFRGSAAWREPPGGDPAVPGECPVQTRLDVISARTCRGVLGAPVPPSFTRESSPGHGRVGKSPRGRGAASGPEHQGGPPGQSGTEVSFPALLPLSVCGLPLERNTQRV